MVKLNVSPENQVLEAVARIEPLGIPFCAVYVGMSKLSPDNKGYRQLEIVSRLFEPLLNHAQARLFLLSNNDFLLLTAYPVLEMIDNILFQIRALFSDDVFFSSSKMSAFQQIFFLDKDKDKEALVALLTPKVVEKKKTAQAPQVLPRARAEELTPALLEKLLYRIEQTNTLDFVRRQSVIKLLPDGKNEEVFQEFFTSMSELQNQLAPNLNLTTDKALFAILMETLDRRMMAGLLNLNLVHYPKAISLNLNVDSVLMPIFDKMMQTFQTQLIVEFQISDILHRLPLYRKACEKLQKMGILTLLDGIGINEFELLNLLPFQTNYIKFFWSPKWLEQNRPTLLSKFVAKNKDKQIILARCSSEDALVAGKKMGIELFQGHFIDKLSAAMTKNACTFGQECSLSDCILRRSVLMGNVRERCVHQPHLDAYMPLKDI